MQSFGRQTKSTMVFLKVAYTLSCFVLRTRSGHVGASGLSLDHTVGME